MRLNYDCIRDILFYLENNLNFDDGLRWPRVSMQDIFEGLSDRNYTLPDIAYSLLKMDEAGLIQGHAQSANNELVFYIVSAITYDGHEFISKIRSDTVWKKTKGVLSKIGSASVSIISSVAAKVLTELIASTPVVS